MHRKAILSLFIAAALMALLAVAVSAQQAPQEEVDVPQTSVEPFAAVITQTVPLTLTVNISGPDGIQAIEVPVLLNLDIRLAFTNVITTTAAATAEVVISTEQVTVEKPATPTLAATATQAPARTPTAAPAEPTVTPAPPTPRPLAPTATSAAAEDAEATATPAPTEEPVEAEVAAPPAVCPDPRAAIFSPGANETISGIVQIIGTAQHESFKYYKLEYAPGANVDPSGEFAFLVDVSQPVVEGALATVDTAVLDNGLYTLRLTVVDQTGNFPPPCTVTVEIAN